MLINGYNFTYYDEKEDLYSMGVTKTKMNELVGLCNDEYVKTMSTPINGIPLPTHKDFFNSTNSSFDSIIKSNLNSMQKKNILTYAEGQLWYEEVLDEQYNSKRIYHLASDKEHTIIRKARYLILKEWNEQYNTQLNTYGEIFFKLNINEQQDFESRVHVLIKQHKGMENYKGSYACHKITFSKTVIHTELEKRQLTQHEQDVLMYTLRKDINEQMVTKVLTSSKTRHDKALEKQRQMNTVVERENGFGKSAIPMSKAMQERLDDEKYVEHCNEIAGIVIPLSEE